MDSRSPTPPAAMATTMTTTSRAAARRNTCELCVRCVMCNLALFPRAEYIGLSCEPHTTRPRFEQRAKRHEAGPHFADLADAAALSSQIVVIDRPARLAALGTARQSPAPSATPTTTAAPRARQPQRRPATPARAAFLATTSRCAAVGRPARCRRRWRRGGQLPAAGRGRAPRRPRVSQDVGDLDRDPSATAGSRCSDLGFGFDAE